MKKFVIMNVISPLLARVGAVTAGGLIALGSTQPQVDDITVGLTALAAVFIDLIVRKWLP